MLLFTSLTKPKHNSTSARAAPAAAAATTVAMLLLTSVAAVLPARPAAPRAAPRAAARPAVATLTLVRHGQSEWNLANRFTGWVDVDLTERGIAEAREAGRVLKDDGAQFDLVFTSCLRRAVRTSCLLLSAVGACYVPMVKLAKLNEQHPGALTGRNKRSLAKEYGEEQVMQWRRGFDQSPPTISKRAPLQVGVTQDERYRRRPCVQSGLPSHDVVVPRGESFADCLARVTDAWHATIAPALREGQNVLVVSHGNTLRALIKLVDEVGDEDAFHLDMPTACPLVYDIDASGACVGAAQGVWGTSEVARRGRFLYDTERVEQAQRVMRSQVLQNVAVSTISSSSDSPSAISTCDAWSDDEASSNLVTVGQGGESFNVRTLGRPTRQPQALANEEDEEEGEEVAAEGEGMELEMEVMAPPRRNTKYQGVDGEAASSTELSAQARSDLGADLGPTPRRSRAALAPLSPPNLARPRPTSPRPLSLISPRSRPDLARSPPGSRRRRPWSSPSSPPATGGAPARPTPRGRTRRRGGRRGAASSCCATATPSGTRRTGSPAGPTRRSRSVGGRRRGWRARCSVRRG